MIVRGFGGVTRSKFIALEVFGLWAPNLMVRVIGQYSRLMDA